MTPTLKHRLARRVPLLLLTVFAWHVFVPRTGGAQDEAAWKYGHVVLTVQNSGAHRRVSLAIIEMLRRLFVLKPAGTAMSLFGFDDRFKQLDGMRWERDVVAIVSAASNPKRLEDALGELVFHGPSPVYDAVRLAIEAARKADPEDKRPGAVLLVSNGIDNASRTKFEDLEREAGQAAVPVIVIYFPDTPPQGGDTRMKKLAKASNGRFVDVRDKDSWEQLMAALR